MSALIKFEGETRIEGKKIGNLCIIRGSEKLKKYDGKKLHYKLIISDKDYTKHRIIYTGFKKGRHYFKVTSADSDEEYMVDVSFGCDCRYSSIKGIPLGIPCKHIKLALSKFLQ